VAPVVASSKSEHPSGDNDGGSVESPVSWVVAAAARRELGGVDAASLDTAATAGVTVVGRVTRTGHQTTTAEFNADGSRATVTTASANLWTHVITTKVSVFDTNTGRQIGRTTTTTGSTVLDSSATTLDGEDSSVLNPAGTRAVVTTVVTNPTTNAKTTKVTVIDTATGNQVGDVITLAGEIWPQTVLFGADGIHGIISTSGTDPVNGASNMQYSTIDTDNGAKVGTTLVLPGFLSSSPVFSNDRKNVTFTTYGGNANTSTTWVGVIDTSSGNQIGSTLAYSGVGNSTPTFSDDGSRLLIVTPTSYPPQGFNTRVSVVSTITGTQIGKSLTFSGTASGVMSADGAHALIIANTINWLSLTTTSRVSILRIA